MGIQNFVDDLTGFLSPRWAASRKAYRAANDAFMKYDAAQASRRTKGWRVVSGDADLEVGADGARLRDVGRELVRNNPFANRIVSVITNNTVGKGIRPNIRSTSEQQREQIEGLIESHLETTAVDAYGRHDLYGIQALVMRGVVESGECLVRRRPRTSRDKLPLPFALQVLEADYLDGSRNERLPDGGVIINGVEYSRIGLPRAYWLFDTHPGSQNAKVKQEQSRRVLARDVAHIFHTDRAEQGRGASWFAPVAVKLHDLQDYAAAQIYRQKVAACFAAFITGDPEEANLNDETDEDGTTRKIEKLAPGMVKYLSPGEHVEFANPPSISDYDAYTKAILHEIAAGVGVSYEALTGDLAGANFSSNRMGFLEFARSIDAWQAHMLKPQLNEKIGAWFLQAVTLAEGPALTKGVRLYWTPPIREMVSPKDEVPAKVAAAQAGITSRSQIIRSLGGDPVRLDEEIAEDNARADKLGLVFSTDMRAAKASPPPAADDEETETEGQDDADEK